MRRTTCFQRFSFGNMEGKHWCLTINNYEQECAEFDDEQMQYLICGVEVGEKKTKHLQCYVQFKKKKRFTAVKKIWPTAHIELARGKPKQNVDYCSKEGKSHEHGECLNGQGTRSDLDDIKRLVDENCSLTEIRDHHYGSFIRYQKSIRSDRELVRPHRTQPTELHIYWGATGTGKSKKCNDDFPQAYWKPYGKWWDDYDGQETVIIDEYYGWLPFSVMLRLCDWTPLLVPRKGDHAKFTAKRIICTSNVHPDEWYPGIDPEVKKALKRRITSCVEFKCLELTDKT